MRSASRGHTSSVTTIPDRESRLRGVREPLESLRKHKAPGVFTTPGASFIGSGGGAISSRLQAPASRARPISGVMSKDNTDTTDLGGNRPRATAGQRSGLSSPMTSHPGQTRDLLTQAWGQARAGTASCPSPCPPWRASLELESRLASTACQFSGKGSLAQTTLPPTAVLPNPSKFRLPTPLSRQVMLPSLIRL